MLGYLYKFKYNADTCRYDVILDVCEEMSPLRDDSNIYYIEGKYFALNNIDVLNHTCVCYLSDKEISNIELEIMFKKAIIPVIEKEIANLKGYLLAVQR